MKLKLTSVLGASAIALGAFGAHALAEILTETELASYKTGVFYHLVHAVYLLGLIALSKKTNIKWPFYLGFVGVFLFSGSIYLLALDRVLSINLGFLWPLTPLGGLLLIVSWFSLFKVLETSN